MNKQTLFLTCALFVSTIAMADPSKAVPPSIDPGAGTASPSPQATSSSTYSQTTSQDQGGENLHEPNTFSADEIVQAMQSFGASADTLGATMVSGIASVIEKFGQPSAVIVGGEVQGSLIIGYRKGEGKILFKGQDPSSAAKVYWEAPSIGFGAGLTASKVCMLVYGAADEKSLLGTYGSGEGSAHWVAGGSVSYLNNFKNISLAHVAVGVGFDLDARVEGLTITDHNSWLPFF